MRGMCRGRRWLSDTSFSILGRKEKEGGRNILMLGVINIHWGRVLAASSWLKRVKFLVLANRLGLVLMD